MRPSISPKKLPVDTCTRRIVRHQMMGGPAGEFIKIKILSQVSLEITEFHRIEEIPLKLSNPTSWF